MKLNFASPRRLSVCDKVSVSVKNQPMLFFSMHNHKIAPLALLDVNKNLIRIERKLHLLTNCTDSPSPAALPPEPLIPSFGCWEEGGGRLHLPPDTKTLESLRHCTVEMKETWYNWRPWQLRGEELVSHQSIQNLNIQMGGQMLSV